MDNIYKKIIQDDVLQNGTVTIGNWYISVF